MAKTPTLEQMTLEEAEKVYEDVGVKFIPYGGNYLLVGGFFIYKMNPSTGYYEKWKDVRTMIAERGE